MEVRFLVYKVFFDCRVWLIGSLVMGLEMFVRVNGRLGGVYFLRFAVFFIFGENCRGFRVIFFKGVIVV